MIVRGSRFILFVIILLSAAVFAQTQPNVENGFKRYGSHDGSNLDSVNLMAGNWMLHGELLPEILQRGALDANYVLYASSKNWQVGCIPSAAPTGRTCYWTGGGTGVFLQRSNALTVHRTVVLSNDGTTPTYQALGYTLISPDGATHQLYGLPNTADTNGDPSVYETIDTTGYHVVVSNPDTNRVPTTLTAMDRQGRLYSGAWGRYQQCSKPPRNQLPSPGGHAPIIDDAPIGDRYCSQSLHMSLVTDANGNQMSYNAPSGSQQGMDTLGRNQPLEGGGGLGGATSDYSGCTSVRAITYAVIYSYAGPYGVTNQIKVCAAPVAFHTTFHETLSDGTPVIEAQDYSPNYNSALGGYAVLAIVAVVLPDGNQWTFDYDDYVELSSVGLPTGGSIKLTWTTISFNGCSSASTAVSRAVATRTVNDNQGHSRTWSYNWGTPSNGTLINQATDPLGNDSVHTFTALTTGCEGFYETRTQTYQGTGSGRQLLQQVDTSFSSQGLAVSTGVGGGVGNVVPTSIKTTIYPSGKLSLVAKTYDAGLGTNAPIFGNVISEKVYDWGPGAPGPLLRETDTAYMWQNDARYLTAHLLDLPASVVIKDGNGNRVAETDYTYDEPQYLTASNITTQHGTPPSAVRGNLTTVSRWLNPGNSMISSHTNWYDTGESYQQIDPLGNTTTHSYDPFYAGAYSTKTCDALSHCVSGTYDFSTGLLTSFTNANATSQASGNAPGDSAHTTNYAYDFMSRMMSATLPADSSGNQPQTTFNYPDLTTVERLHKITASLIDDAFTYSDGLGRTIRAKHVVPGGNALMDTTYDGLDRPATVSNPYFSTSDVTYGVTQSQYDALGRVIQITKQDGSMSSISYSDNCTITTDEAGKQRRACVDGAGRLVEVDEPGDFFPGSQSTGSLAINGSLQSKSGVGAIGAAKAGATVTINGTNQVIPGSPAPRCAPGTICDTTPNPALYDSGKVYIRVNGHEYDYFYGHGGSSPDSAAGVAQGLVNAIQADAGRVINASVPANGATITLTAVNAGSAGNYAFSTGSTYDTIDFSGPSFTTSPASSSLSGGTDSYPGVTVYDSGTVTARIGSFTASANYGQSGNSTATQVASALASALSVANSPVTASASGSNVAILYKTIGTAGDLAVTVNSSSGQSQYFSSASFSSAGGALSGGFNPQGPSLDHAYYVTLYFYNALGNLLCVEQRGNVAGTGCNSPPSSDAGSPWRVRRFTYDSLSRLLTANNPESGLISYSYDADGNLLQKTSPAANQLGPATTTISYCYDALHRVIGKSYSAQTCPLSSPVVAYTYDQGPNGIGHLSRVIDQAGVAIYSYDVLGRISSEAHTIAGVTKTMSYSYNLDGSIATITYPSGAVITYTPDSAGRMLSAIDNGNQINYVTGAAYGPDNSLTGSTYGQSGSFSGIINSFSYNNRLQPATLWSSSPVRTLMYLVYDFHLGNGDNGNVYGITNNRDTSRSQSFTYDPLNRLISAQNAGTDCSATLPDGHTEYWGNSYVYDAWGNLNQKQVTKCSAENLSVTVGANNWLQGAYLYDSAGNMVHDATTNLDYVYDQENRIASTAGFQNTYDADGNRVEKSNGTTGTLYWYMAPGIVEESDLSGNLKSEYVFFAGQRVARKDFPGNAVSYYFSDHLKTAAVVTDAAGNIKSESDYYPWGGELQFSSNDSNHYKFTGKERDAESGLSYFGARYLSSSMGRWMSPDWSEKPSAIPYSDLSDPQTFNLYGYVRNNPITHLDADGHLFSHWHFGITFVAALKTHHGFFVSLKLAWKATAVDFRKGSQGTDAAHTNVHAMGGTKDDGKPQSTAEAQAGIAQSIADAKEKGDTAQVLHTVEDQATPLHKDHVWSGFLSKSTPKHVLGDIFPSIGTIKNAFNNAVEQLKSQAPTAAPPATPPPAAEPPPNTDER